MHRCRSLSFCLTIGARETNMRVCRRQWRRVEKHRSVTLPLNDREKVKPEKLVYLTTYTNVHTLTVFLYIRARVSFSTMKSLLIRSLSCPSKRTKERTHGRKKEKAIRHLYVRAVLWLEIQSMLLLSSSSSSSSLVWTQWREENVRRLKTDDDSYQPSLKSVFWSGDDAIFLFLPFKNKVSATKYEREGEKKCARRDTVCDGHFRQKCISLRFTDQWRSRKRIEFSSLSLSANRWTLDEFDTEKSFFFLWLLSHLRRWKKRSSPFHWHLRRTCIFHFDKTRRRLFSARNPGVSTSDATKTVSGCLDRYLSVSTLW